MTDPESPGVTEAARPTARPKGCPECGAPLAHESGCAVCRTCGHSACG